MKKKYFLVFIIFLLYLIIFQGKSFAKNIDNKWYIMKMPNNAEMVTNDIDMENNSILQEFMVPFNNTVQYWYFCAYESEDKNAITKDDMNAKISEIKNYSNDIEDVDIISLKSEMISLNGVKGFKIRYIEKWKDDTEESLHNMYILKSDNYVYELETYFNKDYIDSKDEKTIINSFKIKDTVKTSNNGIPFTDVPSTAWYANAVKYTFNNKIISGYNNYTFAPNDKLSRAMIVTNLYRMEGSPNNDGKSSFSDVASNTWYSKAINWAQSNKIVNGYGGTNKFGPNDNVTRQDLAGILRNYARYKNKDITPTGDLTKYKDYKNISSWAVASMKWAVGKGVITGNTDGTLKPKGTATRAEAAAMIQKYCNKI